MSNVPTPETNPLWDALAKYEVRLTSELFLEPSSSPTFQSIFSNSSQRIFHHISFH